MYDDSPPIDKLFSLRGIAKMAAQSVRDTYKLRMLLSDADIAGERNDEIVNKLVNNRLNDIRRLSMDA